jgi:hypothetical protein
MNAQASELNAELINSPLDYSTALNEPVFTLDMIAAIAFAHDRVEGDRRDIRGNLAFAIHELAWLGNAACNKLVGNNAAGERVADWPDYTGLAEFEAALGAVWPLLNQIAAIADSYVHGTAKEPDELMAAIGTLAGMGKGECDKWENYAMACGRMRHEA